MSLSPKWYEVSDEMLDSLMSLAEPHYSAEVNKLVREEIHKNQQLVKHKVKRLCRRERNHWRNKYQKLQNFQKEAKAPGANKKECVPVFFSTNFVKFGNCIFYDPVNELGGLFEDPETGVFAKTEGEFIALALHGMQQCSGYLYYLGKPLEATEMHQTGGNLGCLTGPYLWDNEITTMNDILGVEEQHV